MAHEPNDTQKVFGFIDSIRIMKEYAIEAHIFNCLISMVQEIVLNLDGRLFMSYHQT